MAIRSLLQLADELTKIAEEIDTNYGPYLAMKDYDTYDKLNDVDEFISRLRKAAIA